MNTLPLAHGASYAPLARAVFVTGKGGVGKTTVAAALAVAAAQRDGGSVFIEFGDSHSGTRVLKGAPSGVRHMVVSPHQALQSMMTELIGSRILARIVLGNFAIKPFMRSAPALRELSMLEFVRQIADANPKRRVVVDMPATGHSIAWLRVARQGRDLVGRGPMYSLCDRVVRELVSPGRMSVVVVTMPERLVLHETVELCTAMVQDVGVPVGRVVVNRVPAIIPDLARDAALALADAPAPVGAAARELSRVLDARAAALAEFSSALDEVPGVRAHPLTLLPRAASDPTAATVAQWLNERGAA